MIFSSSLSILFINISCYYSKLSIFLSKLSNFNDFHTFLKLFLPLRDLISGILSFLGLLETKLLLPILFDQDHFLGR